MKNLFTTVEKDLDNIKSYIMELETELEYYTYDKDRIFMTKEIKELKDEKQKLKEKNEELIDRIQQLMIENMDIKLKLSSYELV